MAVIIFINITLPPAFAADSSPSADMKAKLKSLQEEIASRASKLKTEVSKKLENKAYVGFVKSKDEEVITIETKKGTKIININGFTQFTYKGKTATLKNITVNDYIAALGDIDDTEKLTAQKIIKLTPPPVSQKQTVFGKVTDVTSKTISIQTKDGQELSLVTDKNTSFNQDQEQISLSQIKSGQTIIALGTKTEDKVVKARFIVTVKNTSKSKIKEATSAAESSSSSKTSITSTPTKTTTKN